MTQNETTTMAAKNPAPGFVGFKQLSDRVFLYEPKLAETNGHAGNQFPTSSTSSPPETIMVFGWADGQPRHVSKYTDTYKQTYPSARIIAVLSKTMSVYLSTAAETAEAMGPAILALSLSGTPPETKTEGKSNESPTGKVLVHVFSNGGAVNFAGASQFYHSTFGSPMPHAVLIQDSTPGGDIFSAELMRWSRATTSGIAPHVPFPRWVVLVMSVVWCTMTLGVQALFGIENVATRCRRNVNDPELLSLAAERLYLYSESDDMIGWEAIEGHAAEAAAKGWHVRLEKFQDSPHVSHMRMHPKQYWNAVTSTWDAAMAATK